MSESIVIAADHHRLAEVDHSPTTRTYVIINYCKTSNIRSVVFLFLLSFLLPTYRSHATFFENESGHVAGCVSLVTDQNAFGQEYMQHNPRSTMPASLPILMSKMLATSFPASRTYMQYISTDAFGITPLSDRPTVSVKNYGARCNGVTDDTNAIQNAFDRVPSGYILSFPGGTCLYSNSLTLNTQDVILEGRGAILKATDPANQAIVMAGNRTVIRGMTIKGAGTTRLLTNESTQIWVTGQYVQVVSNDVSGGASAGIIVVGARYYRVIGNTVHGNLADGIHSTEGSQFGLVQGNTLYENGDDSIAVVSYGDNRTISGHIRIDNNRVKGSTNGRGITCIGCDTVTITNNTIYDVINNAGILIAQDTAYDTWGVNGVLIKNNTVSNIGVAPGGGATQQAGIEIDTGGVRPLQYVSIENNTVHNTAFEGIRVVDYSDNSGFNRNINLKENTVSAASWDPIAFISAPGTPKVTTCYNNTYNGRSYPVSGCTVQKLTSASWTQFNFSAPEGQWLPSENTCSVRSTSNNDA